MSYLWLFVLGINLVLGSSIAKNLRVWKIFTLKTLRVVNIANWKLFLGIVIASIPDLIVLLIQSLAYPLTVDTSVRNSTCASDYAGAFLAVYATLKVVWLGAGVGTCWLVRNVPEKFNESKSTALVVTSIALGLIVMWGIGAIVFAQERTIIEVFMTSLLAVTLITVCLAPKLVLIYRKRDGTLMSSGSATATQTNMTVTNFDKSPNKSAASDEEKPGFHFEARFRRLKEDLRRTQKLYERSFENTGELRERFRAIESDLIALQFERDYRADVAGESVSDILTSSDDGEGASAAPRKGKRSLRVVPAGSPP